MRATVLIFAALFGLTAFAASPQAAPAVPHNAGSAPAIVLVAGGCGPGWHRHRWRGPQGHWHSRCVRNH